jgi:hypothetical protein
MDIDDFGDFDIDLGEFDTGIYRTFDTIKSVDDGQNFSVDFSTSKYKLNVKKDDIPYFEKEDNIKYTMGNGYDIKYDSMTIDYYRAIRKTQVDPVLEEPVDEKFAFKFKDQWDPYTGQRCGEDPHGPLYFDPDNLIKWFYTCRLNNLWIPAQGEYHGYYGDALGNGPLFEIKGRGKFPEYNIFRLPITDCYLTKEHNYQFVTIGPTLTDDEIAKIYKLALKKDMYLRKKCYKDMFKTRRPNLIEIKKEWDVATSAEPNLQYLQIFNKQPFNIKEENPSLEKMSQLHTACNQRGVEFLKKMKG